MESRMTTAAGTERPDPYRLTPEDIKEPPQGWRGSLRFFGPGLILSAAIVGSGELIATTALGAEAGFALFWLVVVSTSVKVAVQVELARWTISTGQPAITGFNRVPPKLGRIGWINVLFVLMAVLKVVQTGGVVGAVAAACSVLAPIGGEPLGFTSLATWTTIVAATTIALLYSNRYRLIERGAVLLVGVFVLVTAAIAIGLPFTPLGYGADDVLGGLTFSIPAGALGAAIAMFGLTGVAAEEIIAYTYWCLEKGYARWTGPADGSDAWVRRARGWIRVMYRDALLSWLIYTLGTLAFFVMGAAVLHPRGLVLEGNEMIVTLSHMYTGTLGEGANFFYLVGAIAVLASTLWAALPAWARLNTNALAVLGVLDWSNMTARLRGIRAFTVVLPIVWGGTYLLVDEPVLMIATGGFVGGLFLLAEVVAVWYLRKHETDPRLHAGGRFHALLIISSLALGLVSVYTLLDALGFSIGG
ncbi:MAG: divalent metal cation transporter [Pseudonocardiaceae bacterium]|nr:divalent metal cation transporter [Pseudonocardiaceae bacterium]